MSESETNGTEGPATPDLATLVRRCGLAAGAALGCHLLLLGWFFLHTDGIGDLNLARINLFFGVADIRPSPAFVTFLFFVSLYPAASMVAEAWARRRTPAPIPGAALLCFLLALGVVLVAFLHVPYVHYSLVDPSSKARPEVISLSVGFHVLFDTPHILVLASYALSAVWITVSRLKEWQGMPLIVALCVGLLAISVGKLWGLMAVPAIATAWFVPFSLEWLEPKEVSTPPSE